MFRLKFATNDQYYHTWMIASIKAGMKPIWLGMPKMPNIGIFKMPPKIVLILVLKTPEHLELGLTFCTTPKI